MPYFIINKYTLSNNCCFEEINGEITLESTIICDDINNVITYFIDEDKKELIKELEELNETNIINKLDEIDLDVELKESKLFFTSQLNETLNETLNENSKIIIQNGTDCGCQTSYLITKIYNELINKEILIEIDLFETLFDTNQTTTNIIIIEN